jgi:hypothetical protein
VREKNKIIKWLRKTVISEFYGEHEMEMTDERALHGRVNYTQ